MIDFAKLTARLVGRKRAEAEHRATTVANFVASVADGVLTDEGKILAKLDELAMLPEQLQAAVEDLRERRELRTLVQGEAAVRSAFEAATAQWEAAEAAFKMAEMQHERARQAYNAAHSQFNSRTVAIESARQKLADAAPDYAKATLEPFDAEIARLSAQVGAIQDELSTASGIKIKNGEPVENLNGRRLALQADLRDVTGRGSRNAPRDPEKAASIERQLKAIDAEEAELKSRLAKLQAELAKAQQAATEARAELVSV